jgi:DNA processing protein
MERLVERLRDLDVSCVFLDDEGRYPDALRALRAAPAALFVRGVLPSAGQRAVAVVGSRAAFRADLDRARELSRGLAEQGVVVVSGGALGIDAAAHEGALAAEGAPTTVVLGSGLGRPYPARNRPLFARVVDAGGCVLTPFLPDEPGKRWHFPARNTLIAALAELTVVVAAAARSGALDTADKTRRLGHRLAAIPRTPGCQQLVARGHATPVDGCEDVLRLLSSESAGPVDRLHGLDEQQRALLGAMPAGRDIGLDELARACGISPGRAAMLCLQLELAGFLLGAPGARYRALCGSIGAGERPTQGGARGERGGQ